MTALDLSGRKVLIVGTMPVEIMDITDHFTALGWPEPALAVTAHSALQDVSSDEISYSLIVLLLPIIDLDVNAFLGRCREAKCPVIIVNGRERRHDNPQLVTLSRPFLDSDIDGALRDLGFVLV